MVRSTAAAALLPLLAYYARGRDAPSLGDALQCRAYQRLEKWFVEGKKELGAANVQDGVQIQFTEDKVSCGGDMVPVMFAKWTMQGVGAKHIFNAIADVRHQGGDDLRKVEIIYDGSRPASGTKAAWDPLARGVMLQYKATPFSDRRIFEWESYAKSEDEKEFWFAATSEGNDLLREIKPADDESNSGFMSFIRSHIMKPVLADSCMSANHIKQVGDTVYVTTSDVINGHPPFGISPGRVTKLTWGKTATFVAGVKKRALELARLDKAQLWQPPAHLVLRPKKHIGRNCDEDWETAMTKLAEFSAQELASRENGQSTISNVGFAAYDRRVPTLSSSAGGLSSSFVVFALLGGAAVLAVSAARWLPSTRRAAALRAQSRELLSEEGATDLEKSEDASEDVDATALATRSSDEP